MEKEQLDPQVVNLAKAIRQTESGGDFTARSKDGSYGAYQFVKPTWDATAKKYGVNADWESATPQQQNEVAYKQLKEWKDKGYNVGEIASMWNAGEGRPKAYLEGHSGVNRYGVKYDVPGYAKKVAEQYQAIKSGSQNIVQTDANGYITKTTPAPQKSNITPEVKAEEKEGLGEQLKKRLSQGGESLSQAATGEINPLSGVLQTVGAGAGAIGDVTQAVLENIPVVGGIVKGIGNVIGKGAEKVAGTSVGQSALKKYEEFSKEHPEAAGNIGAIGNIVSNVPIFKGVGLSKTGLKGAVGKAMGRDALSETIDAISSEIKPGTVAGAKNVAKSGTIKSKITGLISRVDDPILREAAPVIQKNIPNFDKLKTFSEKLNAIQDDAIPNEANALRKALELDEIQPIVTPDNYGKFISEIRNAIKRDPSLIGDSGEYARRFLDVFNENLPKKGDITMIDVLNARQALDKAAKAAKPKVFDPAASNAYSSGLDAVRNAANKLLDESAPNIGVKESLRRQFLLYKAANNLAKKADKEVGTTRFGRFVGRHPVATGLLKEGAKYGATGLGIGSVGAVYEGLLGK